MDTKTLYVVQDFGRPVEEEEPVEEAAPEPFDWLAVAPELGGEWINYGDRVRGMISWFLNRVTVEHANTGRGWEPVAALLFFVRAYPVLYTQRQLVAMHMGYARRRPVLARERRLAAPPRPTRSSRGRRRR